MKRTIITIIITMIITSIITMIITTKINNKPTEEAKYTETLTTEAIAKYNVMTKQWEIKITNKAIANDTMYNNQTHYYTIDSKDVCDDRVISKCIIDSYGYTTEDTEDITLQGSNITVY